MHGGVIWCDVMWKLEEGWKGLDRKRGPFGGIMACIWIIVASRQRTTTRLAFRPFVFSFVFCCSLCVVVAVEEKEVGRRKGGIRERERRRRRWGKEGRKEEKEEEKEKEKEEVVVEEQPELPRRSVSKDVSGVAVQEAARLVQEGQVEEAEAVLSQAIATQPASAALFFARGGLRERAQ